MRLTSDFWAAAFIRSVRMDGGFAYLTRRGAEEAGALFIQQALAECDEVGRAQYALYGPAPQLFYLGGEDGAAAANGDRLLIELMRGAEAELAARIEQELNFDPDIWLIEVENFPDLTKAANLRLVTPQNPAAKSAAKS